MPSTFHRPQRPTGIIRSLPYMAEHKAVMMRCLRRLNGGDDEYVFYIGMAQRPKIEVLHFYIICGGEVVGRANIADWLTDQPTMIRIDSTESAHKWWAVLSGPFVEPPEKILRRGFQGFRYCEELW